MYLGQQVTFLLSLPCNYYKTSTLLPFRSDTAILLFSRTAVEESLSKPLAAAHSKAKKAIATQLIRHARGIAKGSGLPVFIVSGHRQCGGKFGECFAYAFERFFERGFERVISIGNDCPALTSKDIVEAANRLDTAAYVFGPASDGGAYLVGMRREEYDPTFFRQISWQTPLVLSELKAWADDDYYCLEEKSDVDSPADLWRVLHSAAIPVLLRIKLFLALTCSLPSGFSQTTFGLPMAFSDCRALRGPPHLA